jgi:hypothetical protein
VLPWALLLAGNVASLAANVAVAQPALIGRVIAAWPSFALTASYELLTRQVRRIRQVLTRSRPAADCPSTWPPRALGSARQTRRHCWRVHPQQHVRSTARCIAPKLTRKAMGNRAGPRAQVPGPISRGPVPRPRPGRMAVGRLGATSALCRGPHEGEVAREAQPERRWREPARPL